MKLPLATKLVVPGYADKGGAKLVCTKGTHQLRRSELRQSELKLHHYQSVHFIDMS